MVKIGSGKRIRKKIRKNIRKPNIKKPHIKLKHREPERTIKAISEMKIQGAREIAKAAIKSMGEVAKNSNISNKREFLAKLESTKKQLVASRPTEPMLRNVLSFIINEASKYEGDNITRYTHLFSGNYLNELEMDLDKLIRIGAESIQKRDVILTNCHSNTIVEIFKKAKKKVNFSVIVTETRPRNQGLITAKELTKAGIEVTLCVDSAIGTVMDRVTKVIVGSDAILADGSVVNRIGTLPIAMVAKKFNTPFYVIGETLKYDSKTAMGQLEPIEQGDPKEVLSPKKIKGLKIINPAFDVTPEEYIHSLITEKGIMKPEVLRTVVKLK
ncbi:MAG: S-methyl-5-thioribose-1-phosphate isomerase [Nanoarchaeota archaeon]